MKKNNLSLFVCIGFLISFNAFSQPVNQTSFEKQADESAYTLTSWKNDGFNLSWVNGFNQNRAFVDDSIFHSGKKSLRISYPKGQFGPDNSGAQAPLTVPAQSQYYISYWLHFGKNFSWGTKSQGGKLPGLASGKNCSGCATCDGTNGFTARLMWRTGGKAVLYLYHMDKENLCGDDLTLKDENGNDFYFIPGQWVNVVERVKVNSGSNYDGEVEIWLNQKHALKVDKLKFVTNGDKVDKLYFSTFHGGSDINWVPTVDCNIWFDDFVISKNASDVFTTVSTNDLHEIDTANLIQNPLHSGENIKFNNTEIKPKSIEWIDLTGKSVYSDSEGLCIAPQIKPGVYLLKIQINDKIISKKVLLE